MSSDDDDDDDKMMMLMMNFSGFAVAVEYDNFYVDDKHGPTGNFV